MQVFRFITRPRQLLGRSCSLRLVDTLKNTGGSPAESLITIQMEDNVTPVILDKLINGVRVLDVL